jgi:hypothetical protein
MTNNTVQYKGVEYLITKGFLLPVDAKLINRIKLIEEDKVFDINLYDNQEAVIESISYLSMGGKFRKYHINTLEESAHPNYRVNDDGTIMFFSSLEEAENYCSLHPECIVTNRDGDPVAYTI